MRDTSILEIDLSAIDENMRALRRLVGPHVRLCPVVKADAYGLGAARLGKRLVGAGADMLAVYTPEQAAEVIRGGAACSILVLMPVWEIDRGDLIYRALVEGRLHLSVHGVDHLEAILRIASRYGVIIPLHVEIDTGMCRGGASSDEVDAVLRQIARNRWLRLAGILTHFSCPGTDDDVSRKQIASFRAILKRHGDLIPSDCILHAANTAAALRDAGFHLGMVRVGIAWMGYGEELLQTSERAGENIHLKPAVTWTSRIAHIKTIRAGETVGYGNLWRAARPTRIGLVPVGYADGYPPQCAGASGRDGALIRMRLDKVADVHDAPVIGAVNMDQITIDLTDIEEAQVGVGSAVEVMSAAADAPNTAPRLAALVGGGMVTHAILTGINPRVRRVYVVRPAVVETTVQALAPSSIAV